MGNSPAKQSDALRQQLATMNDELQALDQKIMTKEARFAELRPRLPQTNGGPQTDVQIEFSELGAAISEARARHEHLSRHEVPTLEKRLKVILEAEGADREIRAANAERAAALDESGAHEARRGHILAKIAEIQGELEAASAQAADAEKSAAATYARAVVEGDEGAQQAADAQFRSAQDAVDLVEHLAARKRVVLGALQDEAAKLAALQSDARGRVEAAEDRLSRSLEVKLAAEWDATVEQLARIGARLGAARRMRRESLYGVLRGLSVNRMMPGAFPLGIEEVSRLVDGGGTAVD